MKHYIFFKIWNPYFTYITLPIFLLISVFLHAEEKDAIYFALPGGRPFKEMSLESERLEEIYLRFGERISVLSTDTKRDIIWYLSSKGSCIFYLPEMFVVKNSRGIQYNGKRNILIGYEIVDRESALPLFYKPSDLVLIPEKYRAEGYEERDLMLRREAKDAFVRLIEAAERDGIIIRVVSAFRDSRYQSYLYSNAIKRFGVFQNRVAKPGHSEHQLGTTCDLTTDEVNNSLTQDFENTNAFQWLKDHAYNYGIAHSYPKYKVRVTGYIYEPWHFRYWGSSRWKNYTDQMGLFFSR